MRRRVADDGALFESVLCVEREFLEQGFAVVCGCDEAGRGPLAGPVVGAAVVYEPCELLTRCKDSKLLTALQREELYVLIAEQLKFAVAICDAKEVDELNIRVASLTAMKCAVDQLALEHAMILVDGRDKLPNTIHCKAIVDGDERVSVISAASILAKVTRDRMMREAHIKFPLYGFDRHFGYPTLEHREAIKKFGLCDLHRKTFRGVREFLK